MSYLQRNFAGQDYWDKFYTHTRFKLVGVKDPLAKLIRNNFAGHTGKVFEIGCFPGSYLSVFGSLGYEVNGIDLTPRVDVDLPVWFAKLGFSVGSITRGDFFSVKPEPIFDVVCSFGFVEHFSDFDSVILRHLGWLNEKGWLFITTPNFRGFFQRWFHSFFDMKNMGRHNLNAMDPLRWAKLMPSQEYEIVFCGWFGGINFWTEAESRPWWKKLFLKVFQVISLMMMIIPIPNSRHYSPFCGLIVRKIT